MPRLKSQETTSRDSAAMEKACARATSTPTGRDTTESGIRQSDDILNHTCDLIPTLLVKETDIPSGVFLLITCMFL